ncbi:hypothetical protein MTO96_032339 [Rhipicephalus appendiculatus]
MKIIIRTWKLLKAPVVRSASPLSMRRNQRQNRTLLPLGLRPTFAVKAARSSKAKMLWRSRDFNQPSRLPRWPREVLEEQQQGQVQPSSRRPSIMKPVEGQADVKPPPYCGVIAFKDAVEPHKTRGPQPMNPGQKKAPAAAPQPQHPQNDLRDGVGMLTPAYMRESLYEDENRNMTRPCIFCALMLFFVITIRRHLLPVPV